jgi:signal transduction histidine kinase/ActR/RegA family two-component response regulator
MDSVDKLQSEILEIHKNRIHVRTDRLFAKLLILEYFLGILAAIVISPLTWSGSNSSVHIHVYAAIFLGAVIISFPIYLISTRPGETFTRHVVAIAQILISALWIHLSGGRIETHFHIFGSLAFLGFYRDWKVLITASIVVALDHFFRGVYFPVSVFGVLSPSPWRWLEHTGWVVFEDVVLILASSQSIQEMKSIAHRQASAVKTEEALALAKTKADEANQSKSAFLANMSHEIRTPLGSILGFAQLMQDDLTLSAEQQANLKIILRNGEQLYRVIDDILDLSKVEANKINIEKFEFNLDEAIEDVISLLSIQADKKSIRLFCRKGVLPETIFSDLIRFKQILTNVIGNAIKFTERGEVEVVFHTKSYAINSEDKFFLEVKVMDTGPGISAEKRAQMFLPFSQGDASTSRKHGGTGLGLFISKRLAQELGGDLVLDDSRAHRPGSVFVLTIDIGQIKTKSFRIDGDNGRRESRTASVGNLAGVSVLIVDDTPDNLLIAGRFLTAAGAQIHCLDHAENIFPLIQEREFDVIVMDIQMPGLDGYQAVKKLREIKYVKPIVALTAHALKDERDRCLASGFDEYLVKPIHRQSLIQTVAKFAEKKNVEADSVYV